MWVRKDARQRHRQRQRQVAMALVGGGPRLSTHTAGGPRLGDQRNAYLIERSVDRIQLPKSVGWEMGQTPPQH